MDNQWKSRPSAGAKRSTGDQQVAAAGYILNMAIGYMDNQLRARTRTARVTIRLIEADA
jgi:hypothetical protein